MNQLIHPSASSRSLGKDASTIAIRVEGVTKTYGAGATTTHALRGVDLDVHAGEVLLMEGPSGSGKTTLLSILGAILRPTAGRVVVNGRDITRLPERELPSVRLRELGFVFQGFNLFPALSALENVAIALDIRGEGGRSAMERAMRALEEVGLRDKANTLPRDLSGGQKQRVAIARALIGQPRIILADEPTASLDADSGRRVMELLRSLAESADRAVVIVTHDSRTFAYAHRVVRIDDGRLTEAAAAGAVRTAGLELAGGNLSRTGCSDRGLLVEEMLT